MNFYITFINIDFCNVCILHSAVMTSGASLSLTKLGERIHFGMATGHHQRAGVHCAQSGRFLGAERARCPRSTSMPSISVLDGLDLKRERTERKRRE